MIWRIEIKDKEGQFDSFGNGVHRDIQDLGLGCVKAVRVVQVYLLDGDITAAHVERICRDLLIDPVVQDFRFSDTSFKDHFAAPAGSKYRMVEVAYNPGVMDPVEFSVLKGIRDLGIKTVTAVRTARQFFLQGSLTVKEAELVADKILLNKIIQHARKSPADAFKSLTFKTVGSVTPQVVNVPLRGLGDKALMTLAHKGQLYLNINEMKTIQSYFDKLGREPVDVELETIAQTWSEHCNHKTFRGRIQYSIREKGKTRTRLIDNLFKSTIMKATRTLDKSWCVSVFHDNAGVIKFDSSHNVCFKVETHNHPSALEPFGGSNTGVGGVIRDILGTGLGAKPIANTDVFCFAPPDFPAGELPAGALHPKRVMKGVVSGVRDYGNKMGIPTVNGAVCFDRLYVGNPLVFCGDVGVIPAGREKKAARKGDYIVVAGGRTGRDGIHGATFSSGELTHESEVVSSGAVQIGNPIEEKKVLDVLLQGRDENLYSAVTDCGAGGLSSAVGEMGVELGARVDLDKVPLKYQGLSYTEIWISESQERMVFAVSPRNFPRLKEIFDSENVELAVIGTFPGTGKLELFYQGAQVCCLDMTFLHDGTPRITKEALWAQPRHKEGAFPCPSTFDEKLRQILSDYNVCSKEAIIRRYDHEVQGAAVVKPLAGPACDGPSDASVLRVKLDSKKGIVLSNGINPRFGKIDPYWMAASCIDESIRQIISVGGSLQEVALLDNFCWGNPDKPDRLGGLVRAALGCHDYAVAFGTPFISGKDSFYNEYTDKGRSIAIPGTLLISAIGIMADVNKAVTMDLKKPGDLIYVIGMTYDELGGSAYLATYDLVGNSVPEVSAKAALKAYAALSQASAKGLIRAAHDCSEGGLLTALVEMAFAGGCGATAILNAVPFKGERHRDDVVAFSESNSRLIVEVDPADRAAFERVMAGVPMGMFGRVQEAPDVFAYGIKENLCLKADIHELKAVWKTPLQF